MNALKKIFCLILTVLFVFGCSACSDSEDKESETQAAVEFPFAKLDEIYDSGKDSKSDRFDKKNEGKRFSVDSVYIKSVIIKSSVDYDVFCYKTYGDRTFNFRLFVDLENDGITAEFIQSLQPNDLVSFEATFMSQTPRSCLSTFNNIKFTSANAE